MFHLLLLVAVALGVGFGLSWYALNDGRLGGARQLGPWAAWPDLGSPAPNPYTRALLARTGALQLGRSEGLQFIATADSAGEPLDLACRYRVEGPTPAASLWTLAAVGPDGRNVASAGTPPNLDSAHVARTNDGIAIINVSSRLAGQNWLEVTGNGPFSLVLTFYDTQLASNLGADPATMPAITRGECA
ncbi:MAG: hypothetical protein JWR75_1980 [Devosia sp.]|nr:hypothetical protein [Devosia sp.]